MIKLSKVLVFTSMPTNEIMKDHDCRATTSTASNAPATGGRRDMTSCDLTALDTDEVAAPINGGLALWACSHRAA
jgi:hypothetical protein